MSDYEPLVEKLHVEAGDIVLVVVPNDMPADQMNQIADSFEWLWDERKAFAFVVPDVLKFKVVRADAVLIDA